MAINFNTGPYFDDFDPDKNFYRVLFKPGYAVQARELNQLQSILQHQVSSVGKHLFKKNSIVIPGGIVLKNGADILTITGVEDPTTLIGKTITDNTTYTDPTDDTEFDTFNTAVVLAAQILTQTDSTTTSILYIKYFKSGISSVFADATDLKTIESVATTFKTATSNASTIGKVAILNPGTFFTKDIFVDVGRQFLIIETDDSNITNCIVGLNIIESIVTSNDDSSLLDNSNGYPNQYAPGADRYKIELELTKLDANTDIDDNKFIKMMEIENNVTVYLNNKTEYAELMKTLARRTYDANGNFIVNGFDVSITPTVDDEYVWANIARGKCYLGGYEYERIADVPVALEKPRSATYTQAMPAVNKFGVDVPFLYVAGSTGIRQISAANSVIQFLNATPDTSGVTPIGFGIFRDAQYAFGTSSTSIYKARFDSVSFNKGYTFNDVGGIRGATGTAANAGLHVLHELSLTGITGTFTAGNGIWAGDTTGATGVIYYNAGGTPQKIYVRKTSTTLPVPITDRVASTGSSATRTSTFVSNFTSTYTPMVEVDKDTIKSVDTVLQSVIKRETFTGLNNTITRTSVAGTYSQLSAANYFGVITSAGSQQIVDLTTGWNFVVNSNTYSFTPPVAYNGNSIEIYSTVYIPTADDSTKASTTVTQFNIPVSNTGWTALGHQDVISLDKVVEGKTYAISGATGVGATGVTLTTSSAHGLNVGDTIVVRGIKTDNNTSGTFLGSTGINQVGNAGSNGIFKTLSGTSGTTITYSTPWPGSVISTGLTDAKVAVPPVMITDTDVTSRYDLYSGNDAHFTGTGLIKLKKNFTVPAGQLGVSYKYYTYSITKDYSAVNSYNDGSGNVNYIGKIADVTDDLNNKIQVRRFIDYRTRPSSLFFKNYSQMLYNTNYLYVRDLNLSGATGLVGKYVVGRGYPNGAVITGILASDSGNTTVLALGATAAYPGSGTLLPSGTYYIGVESDGRIESTNGGQSFPLPKDDTQFSYTYTKFLPRELMVYVDRQDDELSVKNIDVSNISEIQKYRRDPYKLPLAYGYMEPYTLTPSDVKITNFENPVYTMLDIYNLDKRVERNEYYTSLALDPGINEGDNANTSVNGFWNENFSVLDNQNYTDNDFTCTIYDGLYVAPSTTVSTINLELAKNGTTDYSTNFVQTGNALTLPYSQSIAISNNRASNFNNLNPFNTIQWNGKVKLTPSADNWVEDSGNTYPPTSPPIVYETVTKIINLKVNQPGSAGKNCRHGISFDWETSTGKKGRVNTDNHLSKVIRKYGTSGFDGTFAKSLVNKKYTDADVKEYLNAGTHFDQHPPSWWPGY